MNLRKSSKAFLLIIVLITTSLLSTKPVQASASAKACKNTNYYNNIYKFNSRNNFIKKINEAAQYRGNQFNTGLYNTIGPCSVKKVLTYSMPNYKVYSQPAIGRDGTIYFAEYTINYTDYSGISCIVALNPDFTVKWNVKYDSYIFTSPTLNFNEDTLYEGLPSPSEYQGGKLLALDTKTGKEKWAVSTEIGEDITASPAIDKGGNIIVGAGSTVYKISEKGKVIWKYGLGDFISSKPAMNKNGDLYIACHDNYVYCLSKSGKLIWKNNLKVELSASVALDNKGNLYVGGLESTYDPAVNKYVYGDGKMFKLNSHGKVLWEKSLGNKALPSSAALDIYNNKLYFLTSTVTSNGPIDASFFYTMDLNGNILSKYKTNNKSVQASPCIDMRGNVYIGYMKDSGGEMAGFNKYGKILFRYATPGAIIGPATLYKGSLYFGDKSGNVYKIND